MTCGGADDGKYVPLAEEMLATLPPAWGTLDNEPVVAKK
jgi:hypothetical protein